MSRSDRYPWKLFFLLLTASLVGVVALIPYALALSGDALQKVSLPLPLPILLALQFAQNAIFLGVAVGVGLLVSGKINLGAPILKGWLYQRENPFQARIFATSAIAGVGVGAVILILVYCVFLPRLPQLPMSAETMIPLWKRFLACFYGGLDEEVLMRLFLLSLLLWLIGKVWHTSQKQPTSGAFWVTNIVVAILFGLGHVPAATLIMPINTTTMLYLLSLNGIASLLFGYLFWSRGLESAMIAHFSADIVLHIVGPVLLR